MSAIHSDPSDAVEIFKDIRAKRALAMHWGTSFALGLTNHL
jgi:N-acyl-phosphatidylethanolamine-hydrolysing phospholipase D